MKTILLLSFHICQNKYKGRPSNLSFLFTEHLPINCLIRSESIKYYPTLQVNVFDI